MKDRASRWLLVLPGVVVITVFLAYPLYYLVDASLHQWSFIRLDLGKRFIGFQNYLHLASDRSLVNAMLKTAYFVAGVLFIQVPLGLFFAVVLTQGVRGERLVRALSLTPWFIPSVVVGFSWVFMLAPNFGIIPAVLKSAALAQSSQAPFMSNPRAVMLILIFVHVWAGMPGTILICSAGLSALPVSPYESSVIDGASRVQQFRYITLPLLLPVIAVSAFLTTTYAVRAFDIIKIMSGGGPGTASEVLGLYQYRVGVEEYDLGYGSTLAVVLLGVSLCISLAFLRGIVRDVTK